MSGTITRNNSQVKNYGQVSSPEIVARKVAKDYNYRESLLGTMTRAMDF